MTTDLSYFDLMVPCGIEAVTMTSVARELGGNVPDMSSVETTVVAAMASLFDLTPVARTGLTREVTVSRPSTY